MSNTSPMPAAEAFIEASQPSAQKSLDLQITKDDISNAAASCDIEEVMGEEPALPILANSTKKGEANHRSLGPISRCEIPDSEDFSSSPHMIQQPAGVIATEHDSHEDSDLDTPEDILESTHTEHQPRGSIVRAKEACPDRASVDEVLAVEPSITEDGARLVPVLATERDLEAKDGYPETEVPMLQPKDLGLGPGPLQDLAAHLNGYDAMQIDRELSEIADGHSSQSLMPRAQGIGGFLKPLPKDEQSLGNCDDVPHSSLALLEQTPEEAAALPSQSLVAEPGVWVECTISQEMMTSPVTVAKDFTYSQPAIETISCEHTPSPVIALSQDMAILNSDTVAQVDIPGVHEHFRESSASKSNLKGGQSTNTKTYLDLPKTKAKQFVANGSEAVSALQPVEFSTAFSSKGISEPGSCSPEMPQADEDEDVDMINIPTSSPPIIDGSESEQRILSQRAELAVLREEQTPEQANREISVKSLNSKDKAPLLQASTSKLDFTEGPIEASKTAQEDPSLKTSVPKTGSTELKPDDSDTNGPAPSSSQERPGTSSTSEARSSSQNSKDILRAELKAMKMSSVQTRISSLEAEIASKRAKLQEITEELKYDPADTVKTHIKLLHDYNDIRDVGQGLLGMIADSRGVRIGTIYGEFGLEQKD